MKYTTLLFEYEIVNMSCESKTNNLKQKSNYLKDFYIFLKV